MTKSPEIFQSRTIPEKNDKHIFFSSVIYGQSATEYGYGQDGKMPLSSAFFPAKDLRGDHSASDLCSSFATGGGKGRKETGAGEFLLSSLYAPGRKSRLFSLGKSIFHPPF